MGEHLILLKPFGSDRPLGLELRPSAQFSGSRSGSFEHGNRRPGPAESGEFPDQLIMCQFSKKALHHRDIYKIHMM